MVESYDLYLLAIPGVMIAGALTSLHPSVVLHQGLAVGSVIASLMLVEVLYRNPPVDPTRSRSAMAAVAVGWVTTFVLLV